MADCEASTRVGLVGASSIRRRRSQVKNSGEKVDASFRKLTAFAIVPPGWHIVFDDVAKRLSQTGQRMRTVIIHFELPEDERGDLGHRLRNFGEDVFRQVREAGWGSVSLDEVDRATTQISITHVHASKLRRLTSWVQQEADRHHLQIVMKVA